tara:strand:+ start:503 stop:709 length:207 start_codon:yes stop_codon:yes gene_type:complete
MKIGDLVRYQNDAYPSKHIGVVIKVEYEEQRALSFAPYKVRWTNHCISERDWYAEEELTRINLTQRSK